ncbi:MAG: phosphopantetheine-binding protein, partial [Bacteroidota bacterium]|nr:phosphopantetheine-binding protein [Bacteroidota bacterium]
MKTNEHNKTFLAKTGKGILDLITSKETSSTAIDLISRSDEINALFVIWKSLLGHSNFSETDDFFKVGGNSLKAVQLVSRISRGLSVNILLTDIFVNPTIAQLALFIKKNKGNNFISPSIVIQPRPSLMPLSFSQERLWFIDQLEG